MEVIAGLLLAAGFLMLAGGVLTGEPATVALGVALAVGGVVIELGGGRLDAVAAVAIGVGIVLLLLEVPTGSGVAGALGGIAVAGGLVVGWDGGVGMVVLGVTLLVGTGVLVVRTRQHQGVLLAGGLRTGSGRRAEVPPVAPGTAGVAVTALRPGGTARFDGGDVEVHLLVGTAAPGDSVVALRTEDGVLIVERAG